MSFFTYWAFGLLKFPKHRLRVWASAFSGIGVAVFSIWCLYTLWLILPNIDLFWRGLTSCDIDLFVGTVSNLQRLFFGGITVVLAATNGVQLGALRRLRKLEPPGP